MRAEIGETRVRANGTFKKVGQGLWQRVQDEKAQGTPGASGTAQAKPTSDKHPVPAKKPEPMATKPKVDSIGSSLPKRSSPLLSESRDTRAAIERGAKPTTAANDYVSKLPGQKAQADAERGRRESLAVHQGAGGPKSFSKQEKSAADSYLDKLPGQQARAKKEAEDYVSNLPGQRAQAGAGKARREAMAIHKGMGGPKSFTPAEKSAAGSYLDKLPGQTRAVSNISTSQRGKMQQTVRAFLSGGRNVSAIRGDVNESVQPGGTPAGRYKAWAKK